MWTDKQVSIGKTKHSANVNVCDSQIEVVLPFFDKWLSCLNESIDLDGKSYKINNIHNVGDRDETIKIILKKEVKNEPKLNESRKKSFNK
tara:strand:+ start:173 stop:442 length:270 start_codon:yes stop_codon:yes gene_type:complete